MRARNIKPSLFKNEVLGTADPLITLLFEGLWCLADREGRLEDRPLRIKAEVLPYRTGFDVNEMLTWLAQEGFIQRYKCDDSAYISITNFHKHQNPHHMEVKSLIPPPPGATNKFNADPITVPQRRRIYERDGHKCVHCGSTENLSIDHIKAVELGGDSSDDNLRTLCQSCNSSKGKGDVVKIRTSCRHDDKQASHPTDSLIPDSRNTDLLIPEVCVEPAKTAGSPLAGTLPLNDGSEFQIYQSDIETWQRLYPAIDVKQQLRNMKGWLLANKQNRKTKSGITRFINHWLAKEQDSASSKRNHADERKSPAQQRQDRIVESSRRVYEDVLASLDGSGGTGEAGVDGSGEETLAYPIVEVPSESGD